MTMDSRRQQAPFLDRRRLLFTAIAAGVLLPRSPVAALGREGELRFGLTAVVVRESLRTFNLLEEYLSLRIGRHVEFVQRQSYAEIMELLRQGDLEAAWICGYPYVKRRSPEFLDLLVAPVYAGAPLYRSLIIVPAASPVSRLEELEGKVFAYSDPDSNSGYLVPRAALVDAGFEPDSFFRFTFFTFSHAETVTAVSERVADGGAVDSYVYETLRRLAPSTVAGTRIIHWSAQFGFPPIVVRRDMPVDVRERLRGALMGMSDDETGRRLLENLDLDGFAEVSPGLYESIREMIGKARLSQAAPEVEGG